MREDTKLIELLAAVEHERWSAWEKYREKCVTANVGHDSGAETHEERWKRLRETPYAQLTEREKESDRVEVRKTLAAIEEHQWRCINIGCTERVRHEHVSGGLVQAGGA